MSKTRLEFTPWYALADFYNKSKALLSRQLSVIKMIIAMIIVLSISNSQVMSVIERTGEIGTLNGNRNQATKYLALVYH